MDVVFLALLRSCNYAMIAVGFALVFGSCRVFNLLHGSFVMLAAYGTYAAANLLTERLGMAQSPTTMALAVLGASLATALLGYAYFRLLQLTRRTEPYVVLTISMAGNLVIGQVVQYLYGTEGLNVAPIIEGSVTLAGVTVPASDLLIPPVMAASVFGLWWWLRKTASGRALRAVADNPRSARLTGINPDRVLASAVGLAAFLAGLAGGLTAPSQALASHMWVHPLMVSFAVVVLGGRGSLWGAVAGAFALGTVETVTAWVWSEAASQYVALLFIIVGLLLMPTGLARMAQHETR